ncbi:hypothetical protein ACTXT7_000283 [Hymenolepis weldensis]
MVLLAATPVEVANDDLKLLLSVRDRDPFMCSQTRSHIDRSLAGPIQEISYLVLILNDVSFWYRDLGAPSKNRCSRFTSLTSKPKMDPMKIYLDSCCLLPPWDPKILEAQSNINQTAISGASGDLGKDSRVTVVNGKQLPPLSWRPHSTFLIKYR